ncbi:hypothetical protein EJG51_011180 [Undibacterium piscinae]|uniref:Uncharacterized protein n=1 Tax=Undibacterium piscinae TaxID=2495591 RepID=A0A6M4A4Q6_9BURK|nr:hypothetical protein EJG51_011180 [Undibacterium piscinae]
MPTWPAFWAIKIEIDFKYVNIIDKMKGNSNHAFQDFLVLTAFIVHRRKAKLDLGFDSLLLNCDTRPFRPSR